MFSTRFVVKLAGLALLAAALAPAAGILTAGTASAEPQCCPGFQFEPLPMDTCSMPTIPLPPDPPLNCPPPTVDSQFANGAGSNPCNLLPHSSTGPTNPCPPLGDSSTILRNASATIPCSTGPTTDGGPNTPGTSIPCPPAQTGTTDSINYNASKSNTGNRTVTSCGPYGDHACPDGAAKGQATE